MILTADYHTHTPYSHGKNTVMENVMRAKELGLKEIGITDHGFSHNSFPLKKSALASLKAECEAAEKETGVKVLVGMEANLLGVDGQTDMTEEDYDKFDLFVCGKHVNVKYSDGYSFRKYFLGNFFRDLIGGRASSSLVRLNTEAYIKAIEKNPIDILSHIGYKCPCDVVEVAKCASAYGTYIELNSKKVHLTDDELRSVLKTDVRFVIDSDAHSASRVGEIAIVEEQLKRIDFPYERIDNIDGRTPFFRFAAYKQRGQK